MTLTEGEIGGRQEPQARIHTGSFEDSDLPCLDQQQVTDLHIESELKFQKSLATDPVYQTAVRKQAAKKPRCPTF